MLYKYNFPLVMNHHYTLQLFCFCFSAVRFLIPTKSLLNHSYHLCQAEAPRPNGGDIVLLEAERARLD